jgi:hypothetical protein
MIDQYVESCRDWIALDVEALENEREQEERGEDQGRTRENQQIFQPVDVEEDPDMGKGTASSDDE